VKNINERKSELKIDPVKIDFLTPDINSDTTAKILRDTEPDILLQAGAGILKSNIFSIPQIATLNVHGAIAPRLRGGNSVFWVYYYGRPDWLGLTVHKIDKGIDTGEVYMRKHLEYEPGNHPAQKIVEIAIEGSNLLNSTLSEMQRGLAVAKKYDEESTYLGFYTSTQYNRLKANNWLPVENLQ
jgi:methionyl-tRNA formyltransferase